MGMFNKNTRPLPEDNIGRPNLKDVPGASDPKKRPSEEFRKGGNGGETCPHFISMDSPCDMCLDDLLEKRKKQFEERQTEIVNIKQFEDEIRERVPEVAKLMGKLTYGEMLELAVGVLRGARVDPVTLDPMEASEEARVLASQFYAWLIQF